MKRTALKRVSAKKREEIREKKELIEEDHRFYQEIWEERPHVCQNCGIELPEEPLTLYFDHILEKEKHTEFRHFKGNIMILCPTCHDNKGRANTSKFMEQERERLKELYAIRNFYSGEE